MSFDWHHLGPIGPNRPFCLSIFICVLGSSNVHWGRKSESGGKGIVIMTMIKMGFAQS